jgi:hypothetical protein
MHSLEQCYGYVLGPNPDYSIYDQILARHRLLKQNSGIELRLLTSEGFPAVLYLSATDVRDLDKFLTMANWRACSLPCPSWHFPLTVL